MVLACRRDGLCMGGQVLKRFKVYGLLVYGFMVYGFLPAGELA